MTKCELCGSDVKVVGNTTLHYEPIEQSAQTGERWREKYYDKIEELNIAEKELERVTEYFHQARDSRMNLEKENQRYREILEQIAPSALQSGNIKD